MGHHALKMLWAHLDWHAQLTGMRRYLLIKPTNPQKSIAEAEKTYSLGIQHQIVQFQGSKPLL